MRSLVGTVATMLNRAPEYVANSHMRWPWEAKANNTAYMESMGRNGTLFPVVTLIASETSKVEWHLYRKAKSGKPEDREEVTDHLAAKVWAQPNPWFSRQRFVETVQQHIDLTGEGWGSLGYALKTKTMRIPTEIWPMRPDRMSPIPGEEEFIAGYTYTAPSGRLVPYENDEILSLQMPNPMDVYRGMGPVQAILTNLDADRYSAEWNRNFFLNSAQPGGVVELERILSDPEWKQFNERWREQHKGQANAHRVAILEAGAKWKDVAYSMRDMQFAELQAVSVDVIRRAFLLTKFDTGDVDDVNRATAVASEIRFSKRILGPRLERWKGMLNTQFLPRFGSTAAGFEFDYDDPAPEDDEASSAVETAKATQAKTYITDIGFEPKGVLEYLDLPKDWKVEEKPEPQVPGLPPGAPASPPGVAAPGQAPGQAAPAPAEQSAKALAFDLLLNLTGRPASRADGRSDAASPFQYDAR